MTDEQRSQTGWIGVPKWELILGWALRPKPVFNPSIRKRPSSKLECEKAQPEGQKETAQERKQPKESCPVASAEETPSQPPWSSSTNVLEPARPDTFNFRFSADGDFKAKFERLAEVSGPGQE